MLEITDALRRSSLVKRIQVSDLVEEPTVKYLKCRADLVDGSILHINESVVLARSKYSYHWQRANNELNVRWDNAPHHPQISSFPYHRHENNAIHASPRISIDDVLTEIEHRLKAAGVLPP